MSDCKVVYGPQGCGKTKHSAVLMQKLGCTSVIDIEDVVDLHALPADRLVLTNNPATAGALNYDEIMAAG
ncbi:MAG: hypothetical protein HKM00_09595 [Gallionella sp.]|nr:hypothetical protein [Gallionella sp.]